MALPAKLAAGRRLLPTLFVLMATAPALAQAPAGGAPAQEEPKNLKVLPKDWTRAQVVAVMQNFNAGLGVGCDYCHVQNPGTPPDFASDDKPEKEAARAMMGHHPGSRTRRLADGARQARRRADTHRLHHVPSRRTGTEADR